MSKRIAIPELKEKLQKAIDIENKKMNEWSGDINPLVIELKNISMGRKYAFEAVLQSLQGDLFLINLYSSEK